MLSKNQPFRNSFILPSTHPTTNQYQHNTRDKPSLRDINARQRVYAPSTHTLTAIQSYIHSTSDKPILLDINPLKNLSTPQTQTYMYFVGTALTYTNLQKLLSAHKNHVKDQLIHRRYTKSSPQ